MKNLRPKKETAYLTRRGKIGILMSEKIEMRCASVKQSEKECIRLTYEVLSRFWQRDSEFVLDYCADNVVWIGSLQEQFQVGIDGTRADLERCAKEIQPCHLIDAEYHAVAADSKICAVTGRYLTITDGTADFFLQVQQRCSFVWEKSYNMWKNKHLHVSNPMGELKIAADEAFPSTMGKMAHRYMLKHYERAGNSGTLAVHGDGGSLRFFRFSEILFISALGKDSVINTLHDEVFVKTSITEIAKQAKDALLSVHRSYLVNPEYVSAMERYFLVMTNGQRLPVPAKRFNALRDEMTKRHSSD